MARTRQTPEEKAAAEAAAAEKAAAKAAEKSANNPNPMPAIEVRCARGERFCRAGRCFGAVPERLTDYTPEQLEAWEAESNLVVTHPET